MATFREKLSAEMKARGIGVRTLARMIDPNNIESERRTLNRYLAVGGASPRTPRREQIEDALGVGRDSLADDDEDDSLANDLLGIAASMAPGWEDSRRTWVEQQRARIFREAAERSAA